MKGLHPSKVGYAGWMVVADTGRTATYPTFARRQSFTLLVESSVIGLRRLMKLLTINSDQNVYCTFNSWTSAPNWLSRGAPSWSIKFLSNSDSPIAKRTVCMGVLWIQSTWCYLILDARAWNFIAMYYVLFSSPSCLGFTMYTVQHRWTVSLRYV